MIITTERFQLLIGERNDQMNLKIRDLFRKSIDRSIEGVVTIGNELDEKIFQELDEYVVTNEIVKHFRTFFRKYRESINAPTSKMGVWITGFFGSGKSHFLKMLGYILENKSIAGLYAPEFFVDKIPDETIMADINMSAGSNTKVVIFNIDSKAGSTAKTKQQAITDVMLRTFNEAIGLSATTPWVADMERELIKEANYDDFMSSFKQYSGKDWKKDGRNQAFLNRNHIIKSLVEIRDMDEESARKYFDDQVNNFSITTERFAKIVNEYCVANKSRVVFLMDEVGQFVGTNTELMLNLQTCVEDLGRFCNGKAWVVVTSQQELKVMVDAAQGTRLDFSKIQGRFDTRILLSGANADEVIKKRILDKKDEVKPTLETLYETNDARLSNLIIFDAKPTWNGYKGKTDFSNVYPFVSYQFELLQKVFEAIRLHGMTEGKHLAQNERSLLNAFQESSKTYSNRELGVLVPFDDFYQTVENFIDYDVKTVFVNASQKNSLNEFDLRVLKLLFMIKYVKEMPATLDRLATMMVTSIQEDKIALKNKIETALKALEEETLIQKNGDVYDFLTNEEQDVNRQINNTAQDEGEIIRTISQIFYEEILQEQKIKYGKTEVPFNRFIDSHNIGQKNSNNITCKVVTGFYNVSDEYQLAMESSGQDTLIIDLQNGNYINELIKASKISVFKQNHLATMSPSLATILEKKSLELSERRKRAQDSIKSAIKTANIYSNGAVLEIGNKDGKERVFEALKRIVESKYYAFNKVKFSFDTLNAIIDELNAPEGGLGDWPHMDANKDAYEEIKTKLKADKTNSRISTVKSLTDYFGKAPYGWKEIDVKGLVGAMWKHHAIKLDIHGKTLSIANSSDKHEFVRGSKADSISVKLQEKIDEEVLNEVRKIIKTVFNENFALNEEKLRKGIIEIVEKKVELLKNIRIKYEGKAYPGKNRIFEIQRELSTIIKNDDASYVFSQITLKKDFLEENADHLDEIISFYQQGGAQLQNYNDASEIYTWYQQNRMLEDLSGVDDFMEQIMNILSDEHPFGEMVVLGQLVLKVKQIKDAMRQEKIKKATEKLEKDLNSIRNEADQAQSKITETEKVDQLERTLSELENKYTDLLNSVKEAMNLDQYMTSSTSNLDGFRRIIQSLLAPSTPGKKTKHIKLSSLVPVANKKITTQEDIIKVVADIKERLEEELKDTDEISID
jgi:hypothetical protein